MKIKETVKANVSLKAHPIGLKTIMNTYFNEIENNNDIDGAKNVLILGGSSGYGLATRIVASSKMHANTINVCYENEPEKKRTGTAGYWNMKYFNEHTNTNSIDFNIDAFSEESRQLVINRIKEEGIKIDLVVFSLAAGAKMTPDGLVTSALKPIGKSVVGRTIDMAKNIIKEVEIEPANKQEINDTVFVMGGIDWYNWVKDLSEADCLVPKCKTLSYTYIGGATTKDIYRDGTIGKAKEDLEATVDKLNNDFDVEAYVVSAKAIASKASVFIPSMPIYAGCLYEVMKANNVHETVTEHIYRLFDEMIYGDKAVLDEKSRVRIDHLEVSEEIQNQTIELMEKLSDEEILALNGTVDFVTEFYNINGFRIAGVDYEAEVDIDNLK